MAPGTLSGCGNSTAMTVPALWASSDDTQWGVEEAAISTAPDSQPGWSVNLGQQEASGAGTSWIAASGEAASVAALYSLQDPSTLSVTYDVTGPIDGPSASGLLTVGTLALLRGDELDPSVTMTGTIGTDGTIGTVGGVEAKARAAAEAGFSTMLVPDGLTPASVPAGLTIVEVSDLAEAYERLTTTPLFAGGPEPTIATAVAEEGRRQAQLLAGLDDMGAARSAVFEEVSQDAASWTLERTTAEADSLEDDARAFITAVTAEVAAATLDGTATAGSVAAIAPILAPLLVDAMRAAAQTRWANAHPEDSFGIRAAALQTAWARANLSRLTPSLLAVAAATPGRPVSNPAYVESALRAYSAFEAKSAQASKDYITDSFQVTAADVAEDPTLAALASVISSLTKPRRDAGTPGLAGALEEQVYALASWQATEEGQQALAGRSPSAEASGASVALLQEASRRAVSLERDPSMALWMESWAQDDVDSTAVHLGALATAAILAATPRA